MRTLKLFCGLATLPLWLAAQQSPIEQLQKVLPPDVAAQVVAIVTDATSRGLPGQTVANMALETIAKGRSGADAVSAAQALVAYLAESRNAQTGAGRSPDPSEIEAGATALALGVDGAAVSALAKSTPSGRSLAVPLTVLGALVDRGVPVDGALQAVTDRVSTHVSDGQLVDMPGEAGLLIAQGYKPSDVGPALSAGRPAGLPANGGRPGAQPTRPGHPSRP